MVKKKKKKNPPANARDSGDFLSQEDPLEKGMATHPVFLPGNPKDRMAWQTAVQAVSKSWTQLSMHVATITIY